MSPIADGFTPIRNGLAEHLRDGRLTLLEFGVYILLHMYADWSTGIYRGCALALAYESGDVGAARLFKEALRRLKRKRYINYPPGVGKRGGYDVLIHKFEPRAGRLFGTRLNAWKHGEKCMAEYEPLSGQLPERSRSVAGETPETRPNKEIRSKKEEDYGGNFFKTRTTEELRAMKKVYEQGTGKQAPDDLSQALKAREGTEAAELAWNDVLAALATKINAHTFDTWIKPSRGVAIEGESLVVAAPAPEFARMLERHREQIVAVLREAGMPYRGVTFKAMVPQIHAAEQRSGRRNRAIRGVVLGLLIAYQSYERRIFRARLNAVTRRSYRLLWAALNLKRPVQSFSHLSTREVRALMEVITGARDDATRRRSRGRRSAKPKPRVLPRANARRWAR